MKLKKLNKKLTLSKETVSNLDNNEMDMAVGGGGTYLSSCCTINMATCIPLPGGCYTTDTYQPGGTACP